MKGEDPVAVTSVFMVKMAEKSNLKLLAHSLSFNHALEKP